MIKMDIKVLTKAEEKLIKNLKTMDTVKAAAIKMHLSPKTVYNMLYRLRRKYYRARRLVNTIEANKRGHRLIKMVLTDRLHSKEEPLKTEEDEEHFY